METKEQVQALPSTEETITFRLKCDPRIVVSVPADIVHEDDDAWWVVFVNENQSLQTIVFLFDVWTKEDKKIIQE